MTSDDELPLIPIHDFVASKQTMLFRSLKQLRFSGQLIFSDSKQTQWLFYVYLGRIIYATGGVHSVRRWRRNLAIYFPEIATNTYALQQDIETQLLGNLNLNWEYHLLSYWVQEGLITREQGGKMIRGLMTEVMFDITQAGQITYEFKPNKSLSSQLILIDPEEVIIDSWREWQAWQNAKMGDLSPNSAPWITQPEALNTKTSPRTYQILTRLVDGKHTLRDIAVQLNQNLVQVTRSLIPYIRLGMIELLEIPDLSLTIPKSNIQAPAKTPEKALSATKSGDQSLTIAWIDENTYFCRQMFKIVTEAGYKFINITNPLQVLSSILAVKPDLIFVDVMVSAPNGYELCAKLRKLSLLHRTPMIMVSDNYKLIDVRAAKANGAVDFVSKPLDLAQLNELIRSYVRPNHS